MRSFSTPPRLLMQIFNLESLSFGEFFWCLYGLLSFPLVFLSPLSSFPPLIPPFLPPYPSLNCLLFALPPAGHHFNSFLGGSSLSMSSPACSPLQATWMDHSLSAAEELKPHRPPIYCHLPSHARWLSIPFTMSSLCLDSLH